MLKIALPKGRLGEKVYSLLEKSGYGCAEFDTKCRKLVFCDENNGVSYFWVKPADVPVYVELGAADLGVAGKDVLDEEESDIYELLDLGIGKCKMCVAAKKAFKDDVSKPLRVATKFVKSAEKYYSSVGRDVRIIKLNGSIELAPVLGISDVIFDIVETGATLKENNLEVVTEVNLISARLIANRAAYKFSGKEICSLTEKLKGALKND